MNPYEAPLAPIVDSAMPAPTIPPEVLKQIRSAWIACVLSGCVTLLMTLMAIGGYSILGYTAWELIDVGLIFGLAFGIYKKSRTCAILMLVYFLASKILIMVETGKPAGMLVSAIFLYYFALGVQGTYRYHRVTEGTS